MAPRVLVNNPIFGNTTSGDGSDGEPVEVVFPTGANPLRAAVNVNSDGAVSGATVSVEDVTRNGAGNYTVTLAGASVLPIYPQATFSDFGDGEGGWVISTNTVDPTHVDVLVRDSFGAAADRGFTLTVMRAE